MKLAVTAQGTHLESPLDPRFGRAKCFLVVDTETSSFSAVDNSVNLHAAQGAGIQAAKGVVELGVEALITDHVGPKALTTLRASRVKIYTGAAGTVADAIEQFRTGRLTVLESADVDGHRE
jgi:predicted Fe-Mo cluster-binding NifX family protein